MNYNRKRTLIGRAVYIGLTLMAVSVLCVTMYTFFGSAKQTNKNQVQITTSEQLQTPPQTDTITPPDTTKPNDLTPPDTSDSKPTVVPPKDWMSTSLTLPVEGVLTKEHDPVNAVYSNTMNDYRVHTGIDIECSIGDDVIACAYGTVISVGVDPFMGTCVMIDHGDGLVSVYKNLSPDLPEGVEEGMEIFEGDLVGTVGESAIVEIADEPHLHFELTLNGEQIDPNKLLNYQTSSDIDVDADTDTNEGK